VKAFSRSPTSGRARDDRLPNRESRGVEFRCSGDRLRCLFVNKGHSETRSWQAERLPLASEICLNCSEEC
jgi:hypothetical protein